MARRRLIALCAMNWRICLRNFAPADVALRRMDPNGGAPAPILELPAKRVATIFPSRFAGRSVGIFIRVRIAGAVLPGRGDYAELPPVLPVAARLIEAATISDSSSSSLGDRDGV